MNDLTTACKDCVFANYIGKTQTDCKLGRIEKFRSKGVDIIEAEDLEENEFYVLEAWCNAYRESDWASEYENPIEQVNNELVTPLGFVVILGDGANKDLDKETALADLESTFDGIKEIDGEPSHILIANNSSIPHFDVIQKAQDSLEDFDVDFKVSNILDDDLTELECIDLVFSNFKNGYYSVLKAGKTPRKDIITLINHKVNYELDSVGYIKGDDGINGTTVQCVMHKFLNGNQTNPLLSKIEAIQKDSDFGDSGMDVVRTWEQMENE